ncbi:leucine-rich repeat-containing protein 34 isoform X5 [Tyto alba]|uniref:leucine-rich repeat-containing protein 34 isoform X5 n=1 Tax=Tyto alba TaxID=56313 RepID=UPI001401D5E5|nr:leucine-rich repeat-containing protein 34 isoform X5 [Tyto alba]
MSVHPDLHRHYVRACKNLGQPENPFISHVLQEVDKNDKIKWTKGITLKIAGNNHLVPVQRVTGDDLQVLASVLLNTAFVTGLDLRCNTLTDTGAKHMATFLQEYSALRYLNLMFNDIGTSGAEQIAGALHRNETLVYLRMTGNKIGNKGGMFFASMLQINSTLEKLDLGDCDIGMQCLIAIATALTRNRSVKAINLNRPLLYSQEEEATVHVALMLKSNSSLVELHLCKHEMKNFGVERLCEALYENSSLKYLDLSWLSVVSNNISGKGLTALSESMKTNVELSYIYIWGNKIDEATCVICRDTCYSFFHMTEAGELWFNTLKDGQIRRRMEPVLEDSAHLNISVLWAIVPTLVKTYSSDIKEISYSSDYAFMWEALTSYKDKKSVRYLSRFKFPV